MMHTVHELSHSTKFKLSKDVLVHMHNRKAIATQKLIYIPLFQTSFIIPNKRLIILFFNMIFPLSGFLRGLHVSLI